MSILNNKKLIVYLDQNFISNISLLDTKNIAKEYKELFEILKKGFLEEKTVCPLSWFHREEASLCSSRADQINKHLRFLGQVDFNSSNEITRNQFVRATNILFNRVNKQEPWRDAFRDNPDKWVQRFVIDTNLNFQVLNIPQTRKTIAKQMDSVKASVLKKDITYAKQQKLEEQAIIEGLFKMHKGFMKEGDSADLKILFNSEVIKEIPKVYISSRLNTSYLVNCKERKIKESDNTDLDMASHFLPYCDILATDSFMKAMISDLELDKKYNCKVFSPKKSDIEDFISTVKHEIETREPAIIPLVSLCVIPDKEIKQNLWRFLQKINNARNFYSNRDKEWIELINVDDGKGPKYNLDPSFFFGYEKELKVSSINRRTLDLCLSEARSGTIVVIDRFFDFKERELLPNIMRAVNEKQGIVSEYNIKIFYAP